MPGEVRNPAWVRALLSRPWVPPVIRLALVSAYLIGGLDKLTHFGDAIREQEHFGLIAAFAAAVVLSDAQSSSANSGS